MEGVCEGLVEVVLVGCAEHDAKVVTVGSVSFGSDLFLYAVVEDGAGEGIRKGDSDVVWVRVADERYRLLDVFPGLSGGAELQEVARTDVFVSEAGTGDHDIGDKQAFVHRVKDFLRARFRAHPYFGASCTFESGYSGIGHQVGSRL